MAISEKRRLVQMVNEDIWVAKREFMALDEIRFLEVLRGVMKRDDFYSPRRMDNH